MFKKSNANQEDTTINFSIKALEAKAVAEKNEALASLDLLLNKSVGIGDHSTKDFHDNLDEALESLTNAIGKLEVIREFLKGE